MARLCRLLALLAVLLMPFGMAAAPAAEAHHQQVMAAMPMEHCPDQNSPAQPSGAPADCTMACAAALPAADLPVAELHSSQSLPAPSPELELSGIELEIATPPPRLS